MIITRPLRTINNISFLIKTDSFSSRSTMLLSKYYALLWFYLCHISDKCIIIFDMSHLRYKAFIIYLIMEFWGKSNGDNDNEFHPNRLKLLFERSHEFRPLPLDSIAKLLKEFQVGNDIKIMSRESNCQISYRFGCDVLKAPREISSFVELDHFLTRKIRQDYPITTWRIRALAELEIYLVRHGLKSDY